MIKATALIAICVLALAGATDAIASSGTHHKHRKHHAKEHKRKAEPKKPAPAPTPPPPAASKPASFDGTCDFSGAVKFTPPMTTTPQPTQQHADAPGTCTGTFVDAHGGAHQLSSATTSYRAESSGDQVSCAFGLASGTGALTFPDGSIAFTMHEYRSTATPVIRLDGKSGGGAWMAVTPSQDSNPADAVSACNGAGLSEFKLDAHMTTDGEMRG